MLEALRTRVTERACFRITRKTLQFTQFTAETTRNGRTISVPNVMVFLNKVLLRRTLKPSHANIEFHTGTSPLI